MTMTKRAAAFVLVALGCGSGSHSTTIQEPVAESSAGDESTYRERLAVLEDRVDELSRTCGSGPRNLELLREEVLGAMADGDDACGRLTQASAQQDARIAELSTRYGGRHPDMIAARARRGAIEARRVEACSPANVAAE